jgi:predicted DNA binding CopG/RHH family protein
MPKETVQVNVRLFKSDVAELKRLAELEGIGWHTKLRSLMHEALAKRVGERKAML